MELGFDLTKVKIDFVENELVISGKTEPPVSWDFMIKMDVSEAWKLGRIGLSKPGVTLFSKYIGYKAVKRKMLNERYQNAKKTRTGVQPQVKTSAADKALLAQAQKTGRAA